jgi:uncharacterized membrane protein
VPSASATADHAAPLQCDSAAPIALSDAKIVVAKRCASCHSPSGIAGEDYDWTKESALVAHRRNVAAQLAGDTMPPAGYPRPTPEERRTLLCWAKQQH